MPVYGMTFTPIRPRHTDDSLLFVTPRQIPGQQSERYLPRPPLIFCHHRPALPGTFSVMVRLWCAAESASSAISCRCCCSVSIGSCLLFSASIPLCFLIFSTLNRLC